MLGACCAAAAASEFRDGLDAFEISDFQYAHHAWGVCAKAEDPHCMYGLGVLHNEGKGTPRDAAKALEWFRRAAEFGLADAELELGILRAIGPEGVDQDAVQAYMWFFIAAARGDERGAQHRNRLAAMLTDEEQADARRRIAGQLNMDLDAIPSPSAYLAGTEE